MRTSPLRHVLPVLALAIIAGAVAVLGIDRARPPVAVAGQSDVAGLVDIGGGRRMYLECRGTGSPTVVLEAGYRASARYWTDDLRQPDMPRTMVLPAVANFTRVCAYDRPGTIAVPDEGDDGDVRISRSEAIAQPTTAGAMVADLHALLEAARIPGPYVLAGHSLGGLLSRLYASTYPDEVVGLVLVDAYSERLETLMTPVQWAALVRFNQQLGSDTVLPIPGYGDLETLGYGSMNDVMRQAAAASPLGPMPLAVLAHGRPFVLAEGQGPEGFSSEDLEAVLRAANADLATLVPDARFFVASDSGHDIHQDQPALVTEAIRQVVAGVRDSVGTMPAVTNSPNSGSWIRTRFPPAPDVLLLEEVGDGVDRAAPRARASQPIDRFRSRVRRDERGDR